jgi:hypothetical protein
LAELARDRGSVQVPGKRVLAEDTLNQADDRLELRGVARSQVRGAQVVAGIFSTKSARQAGASNGFAKYSVMRAILPSRISPMPT